MVKNLSSFSAQISMISVENPISIGLKGVKLQIIKEIQISRQMTIYGQNQGYFNPSTTAFVIFVPYGTMHIFLPGSIQLSKDRSFQGYLVLDILTNPDTVTLTTKGNILGKNPLPISLLTFDSLKSKFTPLLKIQPATISSKRKAIKWATKLSVVVVISMRTRIRLSFAHHMTPALLRMLSFE